MTKTIYKIDSDGFMTYETVEIEPIDFEEDGTPVYDIPSNFTDVPLPTDIEGKQLPFYRPKWMGTKWIEYMSQEEINALRNQPKEPTEIDLLKQENETLKSEVATLQGAVDFIIMNY